MTPEFEVGAAIEYGEVAEVAEAKGSGAVPLGLRAF
jgi:hypothetical protein